MPTKFYHGGAPGLKVGDVILPRNLHSIWSQVPVEWNGRPASDIGDAGDTVSLTTDFQVASGYAGEYLHYDGRHIDGQVYEVTPIGKIQIDPDWPCTYPTIARCENGALVTKVEAVVPVQNNPRVLTKALAPYWTYADHSRKIFDARGYLRHTEELKYLGYSEEELIGMGPWMPPRYVFSWNKPAPKHYPPKLRG